MSPRYEAHALAIQSFPRVSGDEPPTFATVIDSQLFSPRERG